MATAAPRHDSFEVDTNRPGGEQAQAPRAAFPWAIVAAGTLALSLVLAFAWPFAGSSPPPKPKVNVRVARALGSRGYDKMRVSLLRWDDGAVFDDLEPSSDDAVKWSYSAQFVHKWTNMHLSSAIVRVQPGVTETLNLGGREVEVRLPEKGEGAVGFIVADPCLVHSRWCPHTLVWDIHGTLAGVINSLAERDELDYWMNVGDLFYDQSGDLTPKFFSSLSLKAQGKIHGIAMGNHDYWIHGNPDDATEDDQYGNGIMQWYAQDTMSAKADESSPFDFSRDPANRSVAHHSNFFHYSMIGNTAFISFSGQATWEDYEANFQEACSWASDQDPALAVLMGHWNRDNKGCSDGMATSEVHEKLRSISGCAELGTRLKYFQGHTHCHVVEENNTGFRVGGFGMYAGGEGCENFGLPFLDTRGDTARLWWFPMGDDGARNSNWDEVLNCIKSNGLSACTQYAEVWMEQPVQTSYV